MSNATATLVTDAVGGPGPFTFRVPTAASTHIFRGTLVSQLTSGGGACPYSTASSGVCIGVSQAESDNSAGALGDKRVLVETKRMYALANGTSSDAFADTDKIGSLVYGTDDHTVAKTSSNETRKAVGFFYGFESDGRVRVYIDPPLARLVDTLQLLTAAPADAPTLRNNIVAAFG